MKISRKGIEFIKSFEEFRPSIYKCIAGRETIGYGHVLGKGENFRNVTKSEAIFLLKKDIMIAEISVRRNINIILTQNQYDSLVSFTFNVGGAAFQRSILRQKINYLAEDSEIYDEFIKWVRVGSLISKGLQRRRKLEAQTFLNIT